MKSIDVWKSVCLDGAQSTCSAPEGKSGCSGDENSIAEEEVFEMLGSISPIIAIIAGVLVLLLPNLIRWIIGIYLIVWGILQIL